MKQIMLSLIAVLIVSSTWAQSAKPSFSFNKTLHDFGSIKEADEKVTYTFTFKNTGSQPLVVHNVRASCGCTTPDWSRQPIVPGASGFVKATFDPKNRPGNFNKTITVTANTDPGNTVLRITGSVQQREKTMADIYPRELGPLRLKTSHLSFTKITPGAKKTEDIEFINDSKEAVNIAFDRVPKHITIKATPAKLGPGQKGKITATYDASLKSDWGFVYDQIFVVINDVKDYKKRISINANIQEDFASWTEDEKAKAAKISIDNKIFDFGEIKQGEKTDHTFVITNKGKSNLIIRKVKASCGCTAVSPDKNVIAPGESTNVKASFNSQGKTGRQNKSITVITNDPLASNVLLRIQGNVN